jgi:hypothetical protein
MLPRSCGISGCPSIDSAVADLLLEHMYRKERDTRGSMATPGSFTPGFGFPAFTLAFIIVYNSPQAFAYNSKSYKSENIDRLKMMVPEPVIAQQRQWQKKGAPFYEMPHHPVFSPTYLGQPTIAKGIQNGREKNYSNNDPVHGITSENFSESYGNDECGKYACEKIPDRYFSPVEQAESNSILGERANSLRTVISLPLWQIRSWTFPLPFRHTL